MYIYKFEISLYYKRLISIMRSMTGTKLLGLLFPFLAELIYFTMKGQYLIKNRITEQDQ
jgi:hypothetical protein